MPGKVLEVMVREGDELNRGEPLLILEAMKMQNEINCPVNGIVKSVNVAAEENVVKDDVMLEIRISH